MAAWSLDSLPTVGGEPSEEQTLVVDTLCDLTRMSNKLLCLLTNPELRSKDLRRVGFMSVKTTQHYTLDFFRAYSCPLSMKAVLIVHVGMKFDEQSLSVLGALSQNESMPVILVILIMKDFEEPLSFDSASIVNGRDSREHMEDFPMQSQINKLQDGIIEAGADDVITLKRGESLQVNRLIEAIHRVEINVQKLRTLDQELQDVQKKAAKDRADGDKKINRQLQMAWWQSMWKLPGTALGNIPAADPDLRECAPQGGDSYSSGRSDWENGDSDRDRDRDRDRDKGGVGVYSFMEKIGRGAFGIVYKALDTSADALSEERTVAIKVIPKKSVTKLSQLMSIDQEFAIVLNLPPHPNVLRAHTALHGNECMYLVMEYAGSTNLHQYILETLSANNEKKLPIDEVVGIIEQMAMSISHLHGNMICHRDIKPSNFMIFGEENDKRLRIIDFGLAATLCGETQQLSQCCGSMPFCAPEVLRSQQYNPFAADVWALSLNFLEITFGPYSIEKLLGWIPMHPTDPVQRVEDTEQLEILWADFERSASEKVNNAITAMLILDAKARAGINQVLLILGLGVRPPSRPKKRISTMSPTMSTTAAGSSRGVVVRAVNCHPSVFSSRCNTIGSAHGAESMTLLTKIGQVDAATQAVDMMFNDAIENTCFQLTVDCHSGSVPCLRKAYTEAVKGLFSVLPGSPESSSVLTSFTVEHENWLFSDLDFDILTEKFSDALRELGVATETIKEARCSFGMLRSCAVSGFRSRGAANRGKLTDTWRDFFVASSDTVNEAAEECTQALMQAFEDCQLLEDMQGVDNCPSTCTSAVRARLEKFLHGECLTPVSLPLTGSLGLLKGAQILEVAKDAFAEITTPEVATVLQCCCCDELEWFRLGRELHELRRSLARYYDDMVDVGPWMAVILRIQDLSWSQPSRLLPVDRRTSEALQASLVCIGSTLAAIGRQDLDVLQLFARRCKNLHPRPTDIAFDALLALIPGASAATMDDLGTQVLRSVSAMRPFIVCSESADHS